ncbi:MAG: UDP-N-acetylmuramoyl-L-alanyl-D-glutamate--2,6-diaminopimelate ligase [Erysipelotrichaceae bacterium]|nr:UDP-N-acetylmuramoyl-L-alanyl-D-glutamate--2,6-diaminopimelate ligase [Erysipelotrichaceae bacterium]
MLISKVFKTDKDTDVLNIMQDSRKKTDKAIFFAIKGKINDGHRFIDMAIDNGATVIVHSEPVENKRDGVIYLQMENVEFAFARFSNAFYDYPTETLNTIGITGTNGKTTIAWIIRSIISKFEGCGYIGTMGYSYDEHILNSKLNLTTPKSDELFRIAREMIDHGCKALVLEASSEGLYTHRLDDVCFTTAVFNNLSQDHMDVHGDMESYFNSKLLLFKMLKKDGVAIINEDDSYAERVKEVCDCRIKTYGIDSKCDYRAKDIVLNADSTSFDLEYEGKTYPIVTNMIAKFNVYNLLAVIAVLNENGYSIESILPYLNEISLTPGRCQLVKEGQDFNVVIDFAFTQNSFDKVFDYAESITDKNSKIIAVFGAAGDRDHTRRPLTSKIADARADKVILTYDDPSSEDMMGILIEMKTYFERLEPEIILDRYEAIKKAVDMAEKGDTILVLGKGSDDFIIDKNGRRPWMSDEKAVIQAIKERNI